MREVAKLQLLNTTRQLVLDVQNAFVDVLSAKASLQLARDRVPDRTLQAFFITRLGAVIPSPRHLAQGQQFRRADDRARGLRAKGEREHAIGHTGGRAAR